MKHLAAYLLVALSGAAPSAEDIKTVLSSVGIDADEERLQKLISELEGKDLQQLIAEGAEKLATVPTGGAGAAAPAAGGAAAAGDAPAAEEKEEEKEESDEDMGFGLFD
ncbi:60s acidic ribosomal protein-domain-containing protein [Aspergillus bertholletiae]|uniref:60s acidic ribosomal protein-domain-containing protein n=1 Tax=Aspergillus bertholletiae TaxID=1226010 RepID=A0A5N7BFX2_9EURO|nr:60s acidic ribosomal protein-domain-containing protein [Aspergillus bertholletiae]